MRALLFPGQGEERPGMARAYLERPGPVQCLLERASARVGVDLARAIVRGDLARTEVVQPALVAICLGLAAELAGLEFHAMLGHSLGELAAFASAGCCSAESAVDLACVRGALMGRAACVVAGGMLAIRARKEATIASLLAAGRAHGAVVIAARNAPDRWVLSGERRALDAIAARHPVKPLLAGGAWHSPLMDGARAEFARELRKVQWSPPRRLLVANRHGRPVRSDDDPCELLAGQMARPVEWHACLRTLARAGVDEIVTVGPSRALRALCHENLGRRCRIRSVTGAQELEA